MIYVVRTVSEARNALLQGCAVFLQCGGVLRGIQSDGGKPEVAFYEPLSTLQGPSRWIGITEDLVRNAYVNVLTSFGRADTMHQRSSVPHGWSTMFDRKQFDERLAAVAKRYEKTAPTVEQWCDFLAAAGDTEVTLADVLLLQRLHTEEVPHCAAANLVYHHNHRLKRDTAGQFGY